MSGVVELDLHGCNVHQAQIAIDSALKRSRGVYRIRLIHGCHSGTALRDFLRTEYAAHPKVKRLSLSSDGGITELVLREYV